MLYFSEKWLDTRIRQTVRLYPLGKKTEEKMIHYESNVDANAEHTCCIVAWIALLLHSPENYYTSPAAGGSIPKFSSPFVQDQTKHLCSCQEKFLEFTETLA